MNTTNSYHIYFIIRQQQYPHSEKAKIVCHFGLSECSRVKAPIMNAGDDSLAYFFLVSSEKKDIIIYVNPLPSRGFT